MKRISAILLIAALVLSGCGQGSGKETSDAGTPEVESMAESGEADMETETVERGTMDTAEEGEGDVEDILAGMSLREKVEQMMIVSLRVWKEIPKEADTDVNKTAENTESEDPGTNVTELNDELRSVLKEHHFGGSLLFAENYKNAEQTLKLIADTQEMNREGGGLPLLVATDQEGGNVARIVFGTTGVGNMALAATGDPGNAKAMASIYGEELRALGVNTDFAPVLDVNNNPNNPVIGVRSFSDSPEVAAEYGLAYMEGLHDTGTIATLKHFPGHGNTDTDSHTGFPRIESSYEELKSAELVPFQKAIDAGADMVMTAHIQYPQIETDTYTSISTGEEVYLPATMSRTILTDILREDMGFEGVVVSDALDMAAISDNFEAEDILRLTINAGVNMLLVPQVIDTEHLEKMLAMTDMAVALAEEGEIDIERIDDSVRRILKLKEKYGLLSQSDFTVSEDQVKTANETVGSKEHREAAWEIAQKAVTILKNDNEAFPLDVESGQNTLILYSSTCADREATWELAKQILSENGTPAEQVEVFTLASTAENEEECVEAAKEADHVILVYRTFKAVNLDPNTEDGFSSAVFDRVIEERHKEGKQALVISCQLPYDAARFQEADAILLAYNSSICTEVPPVSGEGSAYIPNLPVALCACFGFGEANGKLPVNIPELDENYRMTGNVLYE